MEELEKALYFAGAGEWRKWLEQHHDQEKGVLLLLYRKDTGKRNFSYPEALEEALCFGWIDSRMKKVDDERFVLRFTPRKPDSIWSQVNRNHVERLIKAGKMTAAGFAIIEEAKKRGTWQRAYTNRVSTEIPSDLEQALQENQTARDNFHRFANSYRNTYIYWLNEAKTESTRKKRIAEIVKRSADNKKPGVE